MTKNLNENIRRELSVRGWSQSELGRRCGLPPSRINEILSGKHDPRLGTIEKLAKALKIPAVNLLNYQAEPVRSAS